MMMAAVDQRGLADRDAAQSATFDAVHQPAGRHDSAVSAATGRPLVYFTPDPLPVLLGRCRSVGRTRPAEALDRALALALARSAAVTAFPGVVDQTQATRFCDLVLGRRSLATVADLTEEGTRISPRNHGLRQQIVFTGGPSASVAVHIYAPHSTLHELMESLACGLESADPEWDPTVVAAVTGYFCVHLHPFLDGNGRWARLVTAWAGARVGHSAPSLINAVFQKAFQDALVGTIWPESRSCGLGRYLALALDFEATLTAAMADAEIPDAASRVDEVLRGSSRNPRDYARVATMLFAAGELRQDFLRKEFGMSLRASQGLLSRLREAIGSAVGHEESFFLGTLLGKVDAAIDSTRGTMMERLGYGRR